MLDVRLYDVHGLVDLDDFIGSCAFPNLRHLRLGGATVSPSVAVSFLKSHPRLESFTAADFFGEDRISDNPGTRTTTSFAGLCSRARLLPVARRLALPEAGMLTILLSHPDNEALPPIEDLRCAYPADVIRKQLPNFLVRLRHLRRIHLVVTDGLLNLTSMLAAHCPLLEWIDLCHSVARRQLFGRLDNSNWWPGPLGSDYFRQFVSPISTLFADALLITLQLGRDRRNPSST